VTVWETGPGWPAAPLKSSVAGVVTSTGGAGPAGVVGCPMMNVTGMVCVPPDQLKSIEPVYVPGVKPAALTLTDGEEGVTPLVVPIFSQSLPLLVVTVVLQRKALEHPWLTPTLMVFGAGDDCK